MPEAILSMNWLAVIAGSVVAVAVARVRFGPPFGKAGAALT